jgi:hypothetical protein
LQEAQRSSSSTQQQQQQQGGDEGAEEEDQQQQRSALHVVFIKRNQLPASWCWPWCFFQRVACFDYLLPAKGGNFGALTRRPIGSGGSSQQPAASSSSSSSSSEQQRAAPSSSGKKIACGAVQVPVKKIACGAGGGWVGLLKNEKRPCRA